MHHSEIGKIIDVFQELHLLTDDPYPVKISSFRTSDSTDKMSIRLISKLARGLVHVCINSPEQDSNQIVLAYYKSDSKSPTETFYFKHEKKFDICTFHCFIRQLAELDKNDGFDDWLINFDLGKTLFEYGVSAEGTDDRMRKRSRA